MIDQELSREQVRAALRLIQEGETRLRELGVLRPGSNKAIDCQYGEWLAEQQEGAQRAVSDSQPDYDLEKRASGTKIQVKTDRRGKANKWRGWFWVSKRTVDNLSAEDVVVCVQLADDRGVEAYYRVPVRDIRTWPVEKSYTGTDGYSLRSTRLDEDGYRLSPELLPDVLRTTSSSGPTGARVSNGNVAAGARRRLLAVEVTQDEADAVERVASERGLSAEEWLTRTLRERYLPLVVDQDLPDENEIRALNQHILEREDLAWDEDAACVAAEERSAPATS